MVHEVGRIVGLLLFAISAAGEESPDPAELVRKYAANQDRLRSFVLKCEDMAEYDSTFDWVRGRRYKTGEIRYDGDRLSTRYRIWNDLRGESPTARDSDSYLSNLWDGERFIGYSAKPGDPEQWMDRLRDIRAGQNGFAPVVPVVLRC